MNLFARLTALQRAMLAVFGGALLIRLGSLAVTLPDLKPDVDLDYYRSLARSVARGDGFTMDSAPNVARTPVYPLFLAGLMRAGGDRVGLFLAVQCLLGAATCGLTVWLASRWLSPIAATVAGAVVALDPNSIVRCLDLRTETLFTLLLVAGAGLLLKERPSHWAAAGLLWSLAALCRPIAVWLPLVVLGVWIFDRHRIARPLAFLVAFLPLIGLWMARNAHVTGQWFVSSISTINLLHYHAAAVTAAKSGVTLETVQSQYATEFGSAEFYEDRHHFADRLRAMQSRAWEVIRADPSQMVRQLATGWLRIILGPGARSLDNSLREQQPVSRWWPPVYTIMLASAWLLAAFGAVKLRRGCILPVLLILYFVGLAGGSNGNSRFRVPVVPMLAVLAAAGAPHLYSRCRQ